MRTVPWWCSSHGTSQGRGNVEATRARLKVGAVAEAEGHHPDLYLAWGKCKVELWTHKINGLTESDFYMAAKADRAFQSFKAS